MLDVLKSNLGQPYRMEPGNHGFFGSHPNPVAGRFDSWGIPVTQTVRGRELELKLRRAQGLHILWEIAHRASPEELTRMREFAGPETPAELLEKEKTLLREIEHVLQTAR